MRPSILFAGLLLVFGSVVGNAAKSWSITMDHPSMAGTVQVPAGDYHVKLQGNEATLTDSTSGKKFSVPVKVEQEPTKFSETAVESKTEGQNQIIQAIDLGGTTTKIEFAR